MDNLDRLIRQIASGCLIYIVNTTDGEIRVLTQEEYLDTQKHFHDLVPFTDPVIANAQSRAIKAILHHKEMRS
jgi:dihydrodipicolinate synthase/N-acetylneuraminate lyase